MNSYLAFISATIAANHIIQADLKSSNIILLIGKIFPLFIIYVPALKVYFGHISLIIAASHMIHTHTDRSMTKLHFLLFLISHCIIADDCIIADGCLLPVQGWQQTCRPISMQSGYITSCANIAVLKASSSQQGWPINTGSSKWWSRLARNRSPARTRLEVAWFASDFEFIEGIVRKRFVE